MDGPHSSHGYCEGAYPTVSITCREDAVATPVAIYLTKKTEPTGLRMTMLYDSVGNRTTLTEPDGYSYTFGYDALNRPIRLRNPNAYVRTFQYDAAGRRTTLLDSTGVSRLYQYDSVGRLTTQVDSNSGGTALVTFVDGYDAVGNRTGRNYNGVVTTWVYDAAYRLTGQQKSGQAATFAYDDSGNMTVKHHEGSNPLTMSYDAANRLTTSLQGASQLTTYGFDNNGNLTSEHCSALSVALTWTYDGENRCLTEERPSGSNHTYTYAPDGLRRSIHQGGSAEPVSFVWDGDDLLNDYIAGGVSVRYDVLDGEVLGHKGGANRYLYVPDPLGSVNHILDTSQSIAGTYTYWPYGEVQSHTGATTPMQFVGALGYQTQIVNRIYDKAGYYRPDIGTLQDLQSTGLARTRMDVHRLHAVPMATPRDPAAACYRRVRAIYDLYHQAITDLEPDLCGNGSWWECMTINRRLPDCRPGDGFCWNDQYCGDHNLPNLWGGWADFWLCNPLGQPGSCRSPRGSGASACCQECGVRVCNWCQAPNWAALDAWLALALRLCRMRRAVPLPRVDLRCARWPEVHPGPGSYEEYRLRYGWVYL